MNKIEQKRKFLNSIFGNRNIMQFPLQQDASFRKYERIIDNKHSFILMDCPFEDKSLGSFVKIAKYLKSNNFSSPEIFHLDDQNGFLLLEDFGEVNYKNYLIQNPIKLEFSYKLKIDLINQFHQLSESPNVPEYDDSLKLKELEIFTDWYLPLILNNSTLSTNIKDIKIEFLNIWQDLLDQRILLSSVMVHRDYHAENLMFLSRESLKAIGLLDFQDALIGSPLYDLVSLFEDSRFEITRDFALQALDYFYSLNPQFNKTDMNYEYHLLGAQRNCKILGIFARKKLRDKTDIYIKLIPLTLKYLNYDLSHPKLAILKKWLKCLLPQSIH